MKSIFKKFLIIAICGILATSILYATGVTNVFADDNFDFNAFDNENVTGTEGVKNLVNNSAVTAIAVARIICVTIAVVILLVIAMKYMMSAPGDRADIKKHAIHYVIGAIILFAVTGILSIINEFAEKAFYE